MEKSQLKPFAEQEALCTPAADRIPSAGSVVRIMPERPNAATLDAINRVIEDAIKRWPLPARVKRLAAPSYRYTGVDVEHLTFQVARNADGRVVGVAAMEPVNLHASPEVDDGLLLHGLYVAPTYQRLAAGTRLLKAALDETTAAGADGLLVKAHASAVGFFLGRGFRALADDDQLRYAHRLWKPVAVEPNPSRRRAIPAAP